MGRLIELTCPNCGAKLETDSAAARVQCAHCGTELVIERKAMAVTPEVGPEKCPKCRSTDRVQKASSVVTSGTSSGYYDGYWMR
jgi:DNA-directed RNA polymerase subunit RPC12/RpoP